jgi:glucans biosynthesis protein C
MAAYLEQQPININNFNKKRNIEMQYTRDLTNQEKAVSKPMAETKAITSSRVAYIDMIRLALIILVIMVHAAVTYGSAGSWTYIDANANDMLTSAVLTFFVMYCQSFFMSLFFFFAGYFTPRSFDRKGVNKFWKDRWIHLGIPMILYTFFLSRIPNYMDDVVNNGVTASFWEYSIHTFISDADEGPTWFLFTLIIFSLFYTLWRAVNRSHKKQNQKKAKRLATPDNITLLGTALVMSIGMFIIAQFLPIIEPVDFFGIFSLLLAFFPFYIIFFIAGILAYRNDWLADFPEKMLGFWKWFSVGLIIFLPVFIISTGALETGIEPYMSGMTWRCAIMSLWWGFACISFSMTLSMWLRGKVQEDNKLALFASPNTFAVYLIHPIVLVAISVGIRNFNIHPMTKFTVSSVSTVVICYALAEVLRRIPVLKEIL